MPYLYRNANNSDKEEVFKLYRTVMTGYISKIWGWDELWQKDDFSTHYKPKKIVLAFNNEKLVAYSQVEEKNDHYFIRMLIVIPSYQNKGIGSHLLTSLKNKSKKQSKYIRLEVFKTNITAKAFYEKQGFKIVGEIEHSHIMESHHY